MFREKIVPGLAIIAFIVAVFSFARSPAEKKDVPESKVNLGAVSAMLIEDNFPYFRNNGGMLTGLPINASSTLQVTGTTELYGATNQTGTSTVTQSVDGLMIGGNISVTATGTVLTLDTNTSGPKMCNATPAILYAESSSSFAPSFVVSVGTSTSAVASTNLVASSTIATTTSTIVSPTASEFLYDTGNVLTAIVGDITNTLASTTHMGNWNGVNISIPCYDLTF